MLVIGLKKHSRGSKNVVLQLGMLIIENAQVAQQRCQ